MRRAGTFFALFVVAVVFSAAGSARASEAGDEAQLAQLLNASRASAGLAPLSVVSDLTAMAEQRAADMAAQGRIFHQSLAGIDGERVGENVGVADSVDAVHQLFMSSSIHRANILGDYTDVGIGVAWANGHAYVDQLFRMPWAASAAPAAATPDPAAEPVPAPAPDPPPVVTTAPTTTTAPPVTETAAVPPDPTTAPVTTARHVPGPSLAAHTAAAAAKVPSPLQTDAMLAPAGVAFVLAAGLLGTHARRFARR